MDPITALLTEAGRVLSGANETAVRQAIAALQGVLAKLGGTDAAAKESAIAEAWRALREAGMSYNERQEEVRDAIAAKLHLSSDAYVFLRDCWDDAAVYSVFGMGLMGGDADALYRVTYSIDAGGTVTLGDPQPVETVTTYQPATESLLERQYSADQRDMMAKRGHALPDGSFPIANVADLKNAIQAYGRASDKAKAKAHIIARAKALGATDELPADWMGSTKQEALADLELAGDLVPLLEKAVRADGTTSLCLITPGWGSSGYYSADVLKRDGPKVFTGGLHMYLDHPTAQEAKDRPERSLRDLAATLTADAAWKDDGAAGPGLYAEARLRSDLAPLIEELAPDIGVSIRAAGRAKQGEAEGRKGIVVEGIQAARSVDFVTVPGRGGKVLDLVEAARSRHATQEPREVEDMAELEEARTQLAEARAALETERAARQRADERLLLIEADAFVADALAKVQGLPPITRSRLRKTLAANPPLAEGKLDTAAYAEAITAAVQEELAYLAEVGGQQGGRVHGMGGTVSGGPTLEESKGKLDAALKALDGARNGHYAEV